MFIFLVFIMKRMLQRKTEVKWQYNIDVLCLVMFMIPFIPNQFLIKSSFFKMPLSLNTFDKAMNSKVNDIYHGISSFVTERNWMQDYSLSVNRTFSVDFYSVLLTIWVVGIILFSIITIFSYCKIKLLKSSMIKISDEEIITLFTKYKQRAGLKKNIVLGESPLIQSPMVTGLWRVYIILPSKCINRLSKQEIGYILLHEIIHVKRMDIMINYIIIFLQIINWFNPCLYLFLKELRNDREFACDAAVLDILDGKCYIEYGKTIINFVEMISNTSPFYATANMGGNIKHIKKRIEKIVEYSNKTCKPKSFGIIIFLISGIFILFLTPISAVSFTGDKYAFHAENVEYKDFSKYFNEMDGSFVLYNLNLDHYTIYNKERSITRVSPNSTYKIYSALFALESGIINKDGIQKWDSTSYPYKEWNQDQTLTSAMTYSVSWYFQNLDRAIGINKMKYYFEKINYGNADLSAGINDYWLESSLLISPVEQVEILKKLYMNSLMFQPSNMDIVKDAIKIKEELGVILSGKTGTGTVNNRDVNGWFIGYVEKDQNTYIFATNLSGEDNANGSLAINITLSILKDEMIYETQ